MYQRINGRDWRNIWLMGDLHGCFALLMARLRRLRHGHLPPYRRDRGHKRHRPARLGEDAAQELAHLARMQESPRGLLPFAKEGSPPPTAHS